MRGITFNDKHSYRDFGLTIARREIGNPSKIKRKERVPFSNTEYDFSELYGGQEYTERLITYVFNVIDHQWNKQNFVVKKIEVLNWLMSSNKKTKLFDDTIIGYYFLAEVENSISLIENEADGTLTVQFTAYPFKISEHDEGNDIWDTFNFLLDYAQITDFTIDGTKEVTLFNPGINAINPTMKTTGPFEIIKGNTTFNIPFGNIQSHDFILQPGENRMTINGNGAISFRFRKELI